MTAFSGSIQSLVKTAAELAALGSPWTPLQGQWFKASDTQEIGMGDGATNFESLPKFKILKLVQLDNSNNINIAGDVIAGSIDIGSGVVAGDFDIGGQLSVGSISTANLSGVNTGDETTSTILTKIGDGSLISSVYLPSYVDDVIEGANLASFPGTGESGKIYVATDTGFQYRWSGSSYTRIVASPGTTDELAEGVSRLYFTETRVRSSVITGLSTADSSAITATDSVLIAFGKLQAQINLKANIATPIFTGSATTPIVHGASTSSGNLTISSTSHATKGKVYIGTANTTYFDEANEKLVITRNSQAGDALYAFELYESDVAAANAFFKIGSRTATNGLFTPFFHTKTNGTGAGSGSTWMGDCTADNASDGAITSFVSRFNNGSVTNRPLFDWQNGSTAAMVLLPNSALGIGGTPTAVRGLHITALANNISQVRVDNSGTLSQATMFVQNTTSGGYVQTDIFGSAYGSTLCAISRNNMAATRMVPGSGGVAVLTTIGSFPLVIGTNDVERGRWLGSGGLQIAASTSSAPHLYLTPGTAVTSSLNNGYLWFDGTDVFIRKGGATYSFNLTLVP